MMSPLPGSPSGRGVLFDFGYTLFAHAPLAETIAECASRLEMNVTAEQAMQMADRIDAAAMAPDELDHPRDLDAGVWAERWKVLYGAADELGGGLGAAVYASMHDPAAWVPYRHTAATLHALADHGIAVAIVSNTGWDVRTVFAERSLLDAVTTFVLSYEVGFVKPDRRIFAAASIALGLDAGDVLMVGDDPRSDGGAVAAGMRTLLLPPRQRGSDNGLASVVHLASHGSVREPS